MEPTEATRKRQAVEEVAFLDQSPVSLVYELKKGAFRPRSIGGLTADRVLYSLLDILAALLSLLFLCESPHPREDRIT